MVAAISFFFLQRYLHHSSASTKTCFIDDDACCCHNVIFLTVFSCDFLFQTLLQIKLKHSRNHDFDNKNDYDDDGAAAASCHHPARSPVSVTGTERSFQGMERPLHLRRQFHLPLRRLCGLGTIRLGTHHLQRGQKVGSVPGLH